MKRESRKTTLILYCKQPQLMFVKGESGFTTPFEVCKFLILVSTHDIISGLMSIWQCWSWMYCARQVYLLVLCYHNIMTPDEQTLQYLKQISQIYSSEDVFSQIFMDSPGLDSICPFEYSDLQPLQHNRLEFLQRLYFYILPFVLVFFC